MDIEHAKKLLGADYTIDLKGSILAYILMLLAKEQHRLNEAARESITDIRATMEAGANEAAGNDFLHAIYDAAGPGLLAFTMGAETETIERFMQSSDPDEINRMAKRFGENVISKKDMH